MKAEDVKREIKKIDALPTLPGIVKKLSIMINKPDISAGEIASLISKDQVLTARLLKLVNSSFYGFPGRISSISHAFVLLGFNVVKGLAVSASVFDMMKDNLGDLWNHSLACSTIAGHIARAVREPDPEEVAVAGLLHDIGQVAIWVKYPGEMQRLMEEMKSSGKSLAEMELEYFGTTHAGIGKLLSNQWNLPDNLTEPITYHHRPDRAPKFKRRACIVSLANIIALGLGYTFKSNIYADSISEDCMKELGLTDDMLDDIIERVMDDISDIEELTL